MITDSVSTYLNTSTHTCYTSKGYTEGRLGKDDVMDTYHHYQCISFPSQPLTQLCLSVLHNYSSFLVHLYFIFNQSIQKYFLLSCSKYCTWNKNRLSPICSCSGLLHSSVQRLFIKKDNCGGILLYGKGWAIQHTTTLQY